MRVRLALPEDKADILALAEVQIAEIFPHLEFDRQTAAESFDNSFGHGDHLLTVCETTDGQIVGYLHGRMLGYMFCSGVFVEQQVLFVRPDKRGSRAAALLIQDFNQWGEIVGAREILFGVSTGQNVERTTRFLQRAAGADVVGTHLRRVRGATNGQEQRE